MSQQDLLTRVIRVLEEAGVEYMVTGSLASSFYGEPRATHDLDLVVRITPDTLERVVAGFPSPDFYIDPAAAREAVPSGSVFNLLALTEGDKVDFWMLTGEPFDRSRFARPAA